MAYHLARKNQLSNHEFPNEADGNEIIKMEAEGSIGILGLWISECGIESKA
jgi:hypothetical protein